MSDPRVRHDGAFLDGASIFLAVLLILIDFLQLLHARLRNFHRILFRSDWLYAEQAAPADHRANQNERVVVDAAQSSMQKLRKLD